MADPAVTASPEFTLTRLFNAPRELVFRAWTDPEHLARWLGPHGFTTPRSTIEMDARPGGRWRATMFRDEDGFECPTGGEFHEIVEPERLVFAWSVPGEVEPERVALITITFAERGDKTEMTFHQRGPADDEVRSSTRDGWSEAIDKLAESLR